MPSFTYGSCTGVCGCVREHVVDALEGFFQFLAKLGKPFWSTNDMFLDMATNTCGSCDPTLAPFLLILLSQFRFGERTREKGYRIWIGP